MKLRKVEIQSFRIYDKLSEGTFDLECPDGSPADFVSIYAPNGFGKTSFYDALEWGFTCRVDRIARQKDFIQRDKGLNSEKAGKPGRNILRNQFSKPNQETFVRITLENGESIERILPRTRSRSHDCRQGPKDVVYIDNFRRMLLEQEAIDKFIRNDDPSNRYEDWASHFGDHEIGNYYKTVLCLLSLNTDLISELRKQIASLLSNSVEQDASRLSPLNEELIKYLEFGVEFRPIDRSYDSKKWTKLVTSIDREQADKDAQANLLRQRINELNRVLNGTEDIPSLNEYLGLDVRIEEIESQIKTARDKISLLHALNERRGHIDRLTDEIAAANAQLALYKQLVGLQPKYLLVVAELGRINARLNDLASRRELLAAQEVELAQQMTELRFVNEKLDKNLAIVKAQLDEIPRTESRIAELNIELNELKLRRFSYDEQLRSISGTALAALQSELSRLDVIIGSLELEDLSVDVSGLDSDIDQLFETIVSDLAELKKLEERLGALNVDIERQTRIGSELQQLLVLGQELVRTTSTSHCPLCQQVYDDQATLLRRILSNDGFSEALKRLTDEQLWISGSWDTKSESKRKRTELLISLVRDKRTATLTSLTAKQFEVDGLIQAVNLTTGQISTLETRIGAEESLFLGLNANQFRKKVNREKRALQEQKHETLENLRDLESKSHALRVEIGAIDAEHARLSDELLQNSTDSVYTQFGFLVQELGISLEVNSKEWKDLATSLESRLSDLNELKHQLGVEYRTDQSKLRGYKLSEIESQLLELENWKERLVSRRDSYVHFVSANFEIDVVDRDLFPARLMAEIDENRKNLLKVEDALRSLQRINSLRSSVEPFLTFWSNQAQIERLQTELIRKETMAQLYEKEKARIGRILYSSVKEYFNEDLINQFYRTIDPHPIYNSVKFNCDFENKAPTLDILVEAENGDDAIVPNLYFSAAQINVLSLSIFLARALDKPVGNGLQLECIFIDDPIQSMDSINILSTIDLIRAIVVNLKKQVILSTHDENFHRLLQKKIPSDRFNSKFLELETYGRVTINEA